MRGWHGLAFKAWLHQKAPLSGYLCGVFVIVLMMTMDLTQKHPWQYRAVASVVAATAATVAFWIVFHRQLPPLIQDRDDPPESAE